MHQKKRDNEDRYRLKKWSSNDKEMWHEDPYTKNQTLGMNQGTNLIMEKKMPSN